MLIVIFLLFVSVQGQTSRYIMECLKSANPYTSFAAAETLLEHVDGCLARAYIAFPTSYRDEFKLKISNCITSIHETDRSKPEYHALEKEVAQLTSNAGNSIVEAQHVISQLSVCSEGLKSIANIDVYEEIHFSETVEQVERTLVSTNQCITGSIKAIDEHVGDIDLKLAAYKQKYSMWLELTETRQKLSSECQKDLLSFIEEVHRYILRTESV